MGTYMTHMISPTRGISVFITPIVRLRPASGATWERFPGLPTPARWRESHTLRGFHDY